MPTPDEIAAGLVPRARPGPTADEIASGAVPRVAQTQGVTDADSIAAGLVPKSPVAQAAGAVGGAVMGGGRLLMRGISELGQRLDVTTANVLEGAGSAIGQGAAGQFPGQALGRLAMAIPEGVQKHVTALPGPLGGTIRPEAATSDLIRSYGGREIIPEEIAAGITAGARTSMATRGANLPVGEFVRGALGPEGASLVAQGPLAELATLGAGAAIGKLKPLASKLGEPIRATRAGQAMEAFSTGAGVPQKIQGVKGQARNQLREMLEDTFGEQALRTANTEEIIRPIEATIKRSAKERGISEVAMAKKIRDAVEELPRLGRAAVEGLDDAERKAVADLVRISRRTPKERMKEGLKPFELGSYVPPLAREVQKRAAKAVAEREGVELLRQIGPRGATLKRGIEKASDVVSGKKAELKTLARAASSVKTAREELKGVKLLEELGSGRQATRRQVTRANTALAKAREATQAAKIPTGTPQGKEIVARSLQVRDELRFAEQKLADLTKLGRKDRSLARQITRAKSAHARAVEAAVRFERKTGIKIPRIGEEEVKAGLALPRGAGRIDVKGAARVARHYRRRIVGHTPFEATPELRQLSEIEGVRQKAFGGGGVPPGLRTTLGVRRRRLPITPTREIERRLMDALQGKEAAKPVTEAYLKHGETTARAISHARLFNRVADVFGMEAKSAPKGWRRLGALSGVRTGFREEARARFLNIKVHPRVFDTLEAVSKNLAPENYGKIRKFFDDVVRVVKPLYTVVNPGFGARNQIWNVMVTASRGNHDVTAWRDAAQVLSESMPKSEALARFGMDPKKFFKQAIEDRIITQYGVTSGEFGTPVGRRIGESAKTHWLKIYPQAMSRANSIGENTARLAHYIWALEKGMTRKQARLEVAKVLFNYSRDAFTLAENELRRMILFYSWYRRIFPLTMRMAFERPGEFAKLGTTVNNLNAMQGVTPAEAAYLSPSYFDAIGIALPPSKTQPEGTRRALILNAYGFADIGRFAPEDEGMTGPQPLGKFQKAARFVAGQFRPEISTIPQLVLSKSLFFNTELDGTKVPLPEWVAWMPKKAHELLGVELDEESNRPYGPNWLPIMLGVVGPFPGGVSQGIRGIFRKDPEAMQKGISWATGIRVDAAIETERAEAMEILRTRTVARKGRDIYFRGALIRSNVEERRRLAEEAAGGE